MFLRKMRQEYSSEQLVGTVAMVIAGIAVLGEAGILWHTLVNNYPYKMTASALPLKATSHANSRPRVQVPPMAEMRNQRRSLENDRRQRQ